MAQRRDNLAALINIVEELVRIKTQIVMIKAENNNKNNEITLRIGMLEQEVNQLSLKIKDLSHTLISQEENRASTLIPNYLI